MNPNLNPTNFPDEIRHLVPFGMRRCILALWRHGGHHNVHHQTGE
jgi:hypothetical protein